MGTLSGIVIAGPTASGKSRLAVALATRLGGTVVNADSMQVYDALRVVTARPSPADEAAAPHRLYGHVPVAEAYSAGRFAADARVALDEIRAAGRMPIFTGGTGLYFKVLLEGLSPMPAIPTDVRAHWRAEAGRLGAAALHGVLAARDPAMAQRLAAGDTQRIVRALEVIDATGHSLGDWQRQPGVPVLEGGTQLRIVLAPPRDALMEGADQRFDAMLAAGVLDEVAALADLRLASSLPAMRAVGVPPLLRHLAGATSLGEAVDQAKRDTRHYIKRQMTWLKGHMMSWIWIYEKLSEINTDRICNMCVRGVDRAPSGD